MGNQPYINANILDHLQDVFPYIPIGSLILDSLKTFSQEHYEPTIGAVYTQMLEYCGFTVYPPAAMGLQGSFNHHSPIWVKVTCGKCGKSCMVKNENSATSPEQFFLQVIFSIWTIHIFSLEVNENDEWHRINKSWNICEA